MLVDILGTNCDQCVCMVQCCFTSTETTSLIRTGSPIRPPRLSHTSEPCVPAPLRVNFVGAGPEPCVPAPLRVNFVGAGPELCVPAPLRVDLVEAGDSQRSGSPSEHSLNKYLFQSDNPKHVPVSSASSFFTLQTDNRLFHPLVHSDRN